MPDLLNSTGLQVKTLNEIILDLENGFRDIYGSDINLDQNSPDGQMINIFAQSARDIRELLVAVNNGFDPDRAIGRILDERVVINNIERQGGTYTIQPIVITTDRTVTLQGLDGNFNDQNGQGFTIQDDAGNEFILIDSDTFTAGATTANFRAREIGAVETTVGTITNTVTKVLGVISVNNASAALETGQDEETDQELRIRRQQSVAIASNGYLNGILAAILNLDGVSDAKVYENDTSATDSNGIPAHSIWAIVEAGANSEIAEVIYSKKTAGAGMRGDVEVDITTESGAVFTAKFDRPEAEDLHVRFDIQPTNGTSFDQDEIKAGIVAALDYNIGEFAETSIITAAARQAIIDAGGGGVPVDVEISDDGSTWVDYLDTPTLDAKWTLDVTRITITVL